MEDASKPNSVLRWRASDLLPWKRPQSRRMRLPLSSSRRCFEPVTVRAAPQNESFKVVLIEGERGEKSG